MFSSLQSLTHSPNCFCLETSSSSLDVLSGPKVHFEMKAFCNIPNSPKTEGREEIKSQVPDGIRIHNRLLKRHRTIAQAPFLYRSRMYLKVSSSAMLRGAQVLHKNNKKHLIRGRWAAWAKNTIFAFFPVTLGLILSITEINFHVAEIYQHHWQKKWTEAC